MTYTYGTAGAGPHAVTSTSDGTSYRYDANGNMTSKQTVKGLWNYVYDTENRLTAIAYQPIDKSFKPMAQYYYDGDGGRTKKVVYRYDDPDYRNEDTYGLLVTQIGAPTVPLNAHTILTTVYVGNLYDIENTGTSAGLRRTKNIFRLFELLNG